MKIIILGAGQVGSTLAENLASEANDITVVDTDANRLRLLQDRLDIRTINGHGARPNILLQAGCDDAEMIIAVTDNDETNMIACQIAYSLYQTPTKIARIRDARYLAVPELFNNKAIPIDFCISPESLVTNYMQRLIEHPGALQVLDFAEARVQLVAIKPYLGGIVAGKTISEVYQQLQHIEMQIVAIYRKQTSIALTDKTVIEINDEIFFVAASHNIRKIMAVLHHEEDPAKRIMISGGGNIGLGLAKVLENNHRVKVIEHNPERAQVIAEELTRTTVLQGDASDRDLLVSENIEYCDVYCSVTNKDEANIMSALLAKRLGARQALALITRTAYAELIEGGTIDIAISPQQATIGSILTHLRKGDVVNVHSLRRGAAEAMEIIAHGDKKTSKVVGRKINELELPPGTTIAAIVRKEQIFIKCDEVLIEPSDHIILLVIDKKHINSVEKLFQVSVSFFK